MDSGNSIKALKTCKTSDTTVTKQNRCEDVVMYVYAHFGCIPGVYRDIVSETCKFPCYTNAL